MRFLSSFAIPAVSFQKLCYISATPKNTINVIFIKKSFHNKINYCIQNIGKVVENILNFSEFPLPQLFALLPVEKTTKSLYII